MINILDKSKCCGCSACAQICPKKCIDMKVDNEGFEYPYVDNSLCINCNLCEKICPILNKRNYKNDILDTYVAYAQKSDIRLQSSSGGIFTLLAKEILNYNGVVYGAAFDENFLVHHIKIENIGDLSKLRGSKYLQSRIDNTYLEVEQLLHERRYVLYSGTACQIAGLKSYLQKDYKELVTVDILCHGVPSPKVWQSYIKYQENIHESHLSNLSFRKKKWGWKKFNMKLIFKNNKVYEKAFCEDYFMQLFLKNICLRPSCHDCKFKDLNRPSDITLGDCWGIENRIPNMDDDKGTSVVLIHSNRGHKLFNSLKEQIKYCEAEVDYVLPPYSDSRKSVDVHPKRKKFFDKLEKDVDIDNLVKLIEPGVLTKIKRKLKYIIKNYNKVV